MVKKILLLTFLLGASLPCAAASGQAPADPDHYSGWQMTEDPVRDRSDDARLLLKTMAVKPGMKVADVGAGAGYFTVKIAGLVGKNGIVYATDTDERWVEYLRGYARKNQIENIVARKVGRKYDTGLDASGPLDLIIMINSFEYDCDENMRGSSRYARKMLKLLRPGGRLVYFAHRLKKNMCGKDESIKLLLDAGFSGSYQDIAIPSGQAATSEYPVSGFFLVFMRSGS